MLYHCVRFTDRGGNYKKILISDDRLQRDARDFPQHGPDVAALVRLHIRPLEQNDIQILGSVEIDGPEADIEDVYESHGFMA